MIMFAAREISLCVVKGTSLRKLRQVMCESITLWIVYSNMRPFLINSLYKLRHRTEGLQESCFDLFAWITGNHASIFIPSITKLERTGLLCSNSFSPTTGSRGLLVSQLINRVVILLVSLVDQWGISVVSYSTEQYCIL
jgi:hypothetical protein